MLKYFSTMEPDVITYSMAIESLMQKGDFETASQFLNQMRALWTKFDLNVYNTMIQLYGKLKNADQVTEVVHEMRGISGYFQR
jgi:pentatricopeptide repeat protein